MKTGGPGGGGLGGNMSWATARRLDTSAAGCLELVALNMHCILCRGCCAQESLTSDADCVRRALVTRPSKRIIQFENFSVCQKHGAGPAGTYVPHLGKAFSKSLKLAQMETWSVSTWAICYGEQQICYWQ